MPRTILNETSYIGAGSRSELKGEILGRGFSKAFVITDRDLVKFGVAAQVTEVLESFGFPFEVFDDVKANPTVSGVKTAIQTFKASKADVLVAVGGGSVIDTAKAVGIAVANPEFSDIVSLEGVAPTKARSIPIIALPTTAGTAAEVTINYVITDVEKKRKFVCVDVHDIPVVAIIDPEMMSTMPKGLTAATGMDALTHAIEAYVSIAATPITDACALKAVTMIAENLPLAVEDGSNAKAREAMAYAQFLAGMAFNNASLGYVHAMAHQLGGFYNLPHGVCNAVLLPHVQVFNSKVAAARLRDCAAAMGVNVTGKNDAEGAEACINAIRELAKKVNIPAGLRDLNVKEEDFAVLATNALKDACGFTNPIQATHEEIVAIYRAAM